MNMAVLCPCRNQAGCAMSSCHSPLMPQTGSLTEQNFNGWIVNSEESTCLYPPVLRLQTCVVMPGFFFTWVLRTWTQVWMLAEQELLLTEPPSQPGLYTVWDVYVKFRYSSLWYGYNPSTPGWSAFNSPNPLNTVAEQHNTLWSLHW